uniref:KIB1-4 beta-propeller domain-containing protein n=1 Tax=Leersia perrieri TaxID=77586 RepID=A0A0D9XDB9_9ORYZ
MMLVHTETRETFLWELAELEEHVSSRCLLSHSPKNPSRVVLVVNPSMPVLWYCRPGSARWFRHTYEDDADTGSPYSSLMGGMSWLVVMGGKFYTLRSSDDGHLVVSLEFSPGPKFAVLAKTNNEQGEGEAGWFSHVFGLLLESDGELFLVCRYYLMEPRRMPCKINVYKLDLSERAEMVKVSTLGERSFFMDNWSTDGVSMQAKQVGLKENYIYFIDFGDKGLYVHDLGRGTTALYDHVPDLEDGIGITPKLVVTPW